VIETRSAAMLNILKIGVPLLLLFVMGADLVLAGFGITPPYVRNTSLTRNSTYEQQILLVRGDPDVPLKAEIIIDAPEIEDWIEIVEGQKIPLPLGMQKVPMTVRVKVPKDADFKKYTGILRIKTLPDDDAIAAGAVSISLGAQVDIDLTVIDREIKDFRVRKISLSDLNEGNKLAWLYFPGKINFGMLIENTGNVDISPSKVAFRIYDFSGKILLEETQHKGRITRVAPYDTEEVLAEIPTRLPAGNYIARYTIYNDDDIKQEGEVNLNILPLGTLQEAGFGFMGLSIAHKISVLLPIFIILIFVLYFIYNRRLSRKNKG
jgi:hypothetical protein